MVALILPAHYSASVIRRPVTDIYSRQHTCFGIGDETDFAGGRTTVMKSDDSALIAPESWASQLDPFDLFPSEAPLEVDLGCGKGRFLTSRALACPGHNFVGVDRLLARLRKVDKKIARMDLENVRLLRIEVSYAVRYLLPPNSVSVYYIFFPDPWPKKRHHRRRLINPAFLDALHSTLTEDGGRACGYGSSRLP